MLYNQDWWTVPKDRVVAIDPEAGSGSAEDVAADYAAKMAAALGTPDGEVCCRRRTPALVRHAMLIMGP